LDAYLGVLEIGNKHGLILGDMPLATCVSTDMKGLPCIVRAVYLDDDDNVLDALRNTDLINCPEIEQSIFYMNEHSSLCLFDAALTGYEANSERLRFSIFPGTYQVTTHALEPSDRVSLVVHGFRVHS
ncbi:MAG: Imm21 family immunity protein, partial [Bryobacteraceae bacterium]